MTPKPLDLTNWQTKKYRTRSGLPVRILCIDMRSDRPIVGVASHLEGEALCTWLFDGSLSLRGEYPNDLINAPQKRMGWVNVYRGLDHTDFKLCWYETKELADHASGSSRIACVPIEWEE